ncbi:hypothetical protein RIF29_08901 [Crotalaria pallida]|uniref:Pectinesterase inhibitor domain-containing protein n=1 Tax=Crotalaria pallida TaxID=3830 RepID=A0AAN9FRA3_CROPI
MLVLSESLYEGVCKEATITDPSCLQLLKADPRIPSAKTYLQLSTFILEFGVKKGKKGKNYMEEVAKTHPTKGIKLCAGNFYDNTIHSFQSAIVELKEDAESASYDAKAAGDGPAYCAQRLAEVKIDNPLINKEVALISTVAFLAINHL